MLPTIGTAKPVTEGLPTSICKDELLYSLKYILILFYFKKQQATNHLSGTEILILIIFIISVMYCNN